MPKAIKFKDYTKVRNHLYPSLLSPYKQDFWKFVNRTADINPNLILIALLIERFGYSKSLAELKKLHEAAVTINQGAKGLNFSSLSSYSTLEYEDVNALRVALKCVLSADVYEFLGRFKEIYPDNQFWGAFDYLGTQHEDQDPFELIGTALIELSDKFSKTSTFCYAIYYEIHCDYGMLKFIPGGPRRIDLSDLEAAYGNPKWDAIASSLSAFMVNFNNTFEELSTGHRPRHIDQWSEYFWRTNWLKIEWIPGATHNFTISDIPNEFIQFHIKQFKVYTEGLMPHLEQILEASHPNPKKINNQVILGLLCRIIRLSIQISSFIANWTADVAEILLRPIAESYINLKWLLEHGQDENYLKFYEHGLGNQALLAEHISAFLKDNGLSDEEANEHNWALSYLKRHRNKELITINLGHWNGSSAHKLAKDCQAEDVYNFVLAPCSSSTHGSFDSVDRFYLINNINPLHGFYKIPNFWSKSHISLYALQNALEISDSAVLMTSKHFGLANENTEFGRAFFEALMEFKIETKENESPT